PGAGDRAPAPARLAMRTIEGAPAALDDPLDRRPASRARLVLAVVDEEDVLAALFHVGDRLRAVLPIERRAQRGADRLGQPLRLLPGHRRRRALRVDLRPVQRLRDLDVAQARQR